MPLYYIRGLSCDMFASSNYHRPCPTLNTQAACSCEHFSLPKQPHSVTCCTAITAVHRYMHVVTLSGCLSVGNAASVYSVTVLRLSNAASVYSVTVLRLSKRAETLRWKTAGYLWPARSSTLCEARPNRRPTVLKRVRVRVRARNVSWTVTRLVWKSAGGKNTGRVESVEEDIW